jgi:hypothetical protein
MRFKIVFFSARPIVKSLARSGSATDTAARPIVGYLSRVLGGNSTSKTDLAPTAIGCAQGIKTRDKQSARFAGRNWRGSLLIVRC